MSGFNPDRDQWLAVKQEDRFLAYYLCLRKNYNLSAMEAIKMAKRNFAAYPEFFNQPVNALREFTPKQKAMP